jgi:hypothetical protein
MTTTQTETAQKNHRRAVRFFWCLLFAATTVSIVGNVVHALLPYIPRIAVEIGAAAVPPVVLLAAVHGIALAVRTGASGRVYRWAIAAITAIGAGAFMLSFRALRDLLIQTGTPSGWAWIFPTIIDTAVGVATLMLVALGDKPARRAPRVSTQTATMQGATPTPVQSAKAEATTFAPTRVRARTVQARSAQTSLSVQPDPPRTVQDPAQADPTQVDADLASELIASGVTTQRIETVIAVLAARRGGASINGAAKASGINYRTAQRIVEAAAGYQQRELAVVS